MIKLIGIASFPLLAAMYCAEQAPEQDLPSPSPMAEIEDRHFLATLESQEATTAGRMERLDREFLTKMQTPPPAPTAVAVRESPPMAEAAVEVRRATVARPAVTALGSGPDVQRASAVTRIEPATATGDRRRAAIVIYRDAIVLR